MTVREFVAGDNLIASIGTLSTMTYGTVVALVKRTTSAAGSRYLYALNNSSAAITMGTFYRNNDDYSWWNGATTSQSMPAALNVWQLAVARKDTGTVLPRWSVYDYGTATWTHADAFDLEADSASTPGATGTVRFSVGTGQTFAGRIAARAAWVNTVKWSADAAGDSAIEAAGLETALQSWLDATPDACWAYNQTDTATAVTDLTGNGADQTSVVGTTVVTGDDPSGFNFTLGGGTTTVTGAATLAGGSVLTAGSVVDVEAAATVAGGSILTADSAVTVLAAASLSGQSNLTAITGETGSATLSGGSTLTADARVTTAAAANLAAGSNLSVDALLTVPAAALLTAASSFAAAALIDVLATGALTGQSTLTAAATAYNPLGFTVAVSPRLAVDVPHTHLTVEA